MAPELAIQIEELSKRYDKLLALDRLNLTIPAGEFFCYLGPNGAGKTTTIKILTGLLHPTSGRAAICGEDIQESPVKAKSRIGYIPDHPYLYEKLTGRDFCFFVADLFSMDRGRAEKAMDEYFSLFELEKAADSYIENYSHGMRQKLVFTASLLHEPRVLVVDEPMVGLDPKSARTVKQLLKRKSREEGLAIFLSTHTLSVAEELADRIGVLHKGRLIFLGTLEEMRREVGEAQNLEQMFLQLTGEALEEPETA